MEMRSKFHRGVCKDCGDLRLLNRLNLCADCTTIEIFVENKKSLEVKVKYN